MLAGLRYFGLWAMYISNETYRFGVIKLLHLRCFGALCWNFNLIVTLSPLLTLMSTQFVLSFVRVSVEMEDKCKLEILKNIWLKILYII